MVRAPRSRRALAAVCGLAALGLYSGTTCGQATVPATGARERAVRVAATEGRLWLARVRPAQTAVSFREPSGVQGSAPALEAPIVRLIAAGREAYAFVEGGAFYRYSGSWSREEDLPERQIPLDAVGADGVVYALVPSLIAAQLRSFDAPEHELTSRPFDPGPAPLCIVQHDSRGWSGLASCPSMVLAGGRSDLEPRLSLDAGGLMLVWLAQPPQQIAQARLDLHNGQWSAGATVGVPRLAGFWVATVNRVPTLLASAARDANGDELAAYQWIASDAAGATGGWRPATLQWSVLSHEQGGGRCAAAFGFSQHLGVLLIGLDGSAYLWFARPDGPALLPTLDVFAESQPVQPGAPALQMLRVIVLLVILGGLLALRRGGAVTGVELPKDLAPAFAFQRLIGLAVDLVPLAVVAGLLLGINWSEAPRQMLRWAFDPQMNGTGLPDIRLVEWWGFTVLVHTIYSFVMELATRRTLGKIVAHVALVSQAGTPPAAWQILVRNVLRFVELLPPFWLLGFFVLLSRNRQRVGDVFARTVPVRHIETPEPGDGGAGEK